MGNTEELQEDLEEKRITVNYSYPNNDEFEYTAHMERIDMDKECEHDLRSTKGS